MATASITMDAGLLAVPPTQVSAEEAHGYVERLLDWAKLLDEPWIALCLSEQASGALFEDGLFPMREQLRALFSQHGIHEYDVNTVATVVNRLLQHTPSFETYYRVRDALTENLTTSPDVIQFYTGQGLQTDLARCMLLLAIVRAHCREEILQNAMVLRFSPKRTIRVCAQVHEIEHMREEDFAAAIPRPPQYFKGEVLTCDDFRGLLDCIDETEVLRSAADRAGVEVAVRMRLFKSRPAREVPPEWDDIQGMTIGKRFYQAICGCCADAAPAFASRALRAICDAVDRQNMPAVHALRVGAGGSDPQRRRSSDEAKAWRRDVDHEYHLHYWEREDGSIEIATVGVHNDFSIPE